MTEKSDKLYLVSATSIYVVFPVSVCSTGLPKLLRVALLASFIFYGQSHCTLDFIILPLQSAVDEIPLCMLIWTHFGPEKIPKGIPLSILPYHVWSHEKDTNSGSFLPPLKTIRMDLTKIDGTPKSSIIMIFHRLFILFKTSYFLSSFLYTESCR